MKSVAIMFAAGALFLAACSGSSGGSVASLQSTSTHATSTGEQPDEPQLNDEEAIIAFASCMRENGVEDFEDPTIDSDGRIEFGVGGGAQPQEDIDREVLRVARDACQEHLDGLAFGPGTLDRSEIEDQLYEFAACMRENGYDMPDPDFSGSAGERGGGGPFGGSIDPEDLAFVSALQACEETFGGSLRFGQGRPGSGGAP